MVLAIWIFLTTLLWLMDRTQGRKGVWQALVTTPRGGWGMVFGHLGVAAFIVGITLTSLYSSEEDIRLEVGQTYDLNGYGFKFNGVEHFNGPNYTADRGEVVVSYQGQVLVTMHPEKRNYRSGMPMTEAGIDAGLTRDLFVALGEALGDNGAWSLRVYHKPFVRWIWLGGLLMALGGLLAASDRRYFQLARKARLAANSAAAKA
jgi:cytochrome c-type biogenesis protein CcmF